MPQIRLLPDVLINQIAAGEVIERPVSVVKELVENALDAAATAIEVDLEDGGTRLVRVVDDGVGMAKDDLEMALYRHATSKIACLNDLNDVRSLGFRGEALSSIASVAKVSIASRAQGADLAWVVDAERSPAGPFLVRPHSLTQGTSAEVRELFFCVPARRKFLRSSRAEFLQIHSLLRRVALSRPAVALRFTHDRRQVFRYTAGTLESRAGQVMGRRFLSAAIPVSACSELLNIEGWILPPQYAQGRASDQFMYLNGRMIRDRQLLHAVHRAWAEQYSGDSAASFVLFLSMEPGEFDINVHPAKAEVRFRQTRMVHDYVLSVLRQGLMTANAVSGEAVSLVAERAAVYREGGGGWAGSGRQPSPVSDQGLQLAQASCERQVHSADLMPYGVPRTLLFDRYLLTDCRPDVGVIDMDAAVAQLLLMEASGQCEREYLRSVPLLLPLQIGRNSSAEGLLWQCEALLNQYGFQLRSAGAGTVTCLRIPGLLRGLELAVAVPALLREICEGFAVPDMAQNEEHLLAQLAQGAVRWHAASGLGWFTNCLPALARLTSTRRQVEPLFWRLVRPDDIGIWFQCGR